MTSVSIAVLALCAIHCAGARPSNLGVENARLAPCPSSPNCVSSDASDGAHHVAAFELATGAPAAWATVRSQIDAMDRTEIIDESESYIHAECTSALMRYVDDLELHLRASEGVIAVRSASRIGYSDMGVNRARVEALREALRAKGAIR